MISLGFVVDVRRHSQPGEAGSWLLRTDRLDYGRTESAARSLQPCHPKSDTGLVLKQWWKLLLGSFRWEPTSTKIMIINKVMIEVVIPTASDY